MEIKKFLSAFFGENDDICFRVFSDRKAEEPEYKGNKYTEKLKNIDTLLPTLKQHNKKNRGVFFVINSGGLATVILLESMHSLWKWTAVTLRSNRQRLTRSLFHPPLS